jgi:hypothetical protein
MTTDRLFDPGPANGNLTPLQTRALAAIEATGWDGLTTDELGQVLHADKHDPREICAFCGSAGRAVAIACVRSSLCSSAAVRHRAGISTWCGLLRGCLRRGRLNATTERTVSRSTSEPVLMLPRPSVDRLMANSSKRKGDRAEIEVQGILRDLLGVPARRKLGAGRLDDIGDIDGLPDTVIQVGNIARLADASERSRASARRSSSAPVRRSARRSCGCAAASSAS